MQSISASFRCPERDLNRTPIGWHCFTSTENTKQIVLMLTHVLPLTMILSLKQQSQQDTFCWFADALEEVFKTLLEFAVIAKIYIYSSSFSLVFQMSQGLSCFASLFTFPRYSSRDWIMSVQIWVHCQWLRYNEKFPGFAKEKEE